MTRKCLVCHRECKDGRYVPDMLFLRVDGSGVWLCGRPVCEQKYNDGDVE